MKRIALFGTALVLAATGAGARPECALACSCVQLEPKNALAEADAAVVATVVERRAGTGGAVLVLAVERRLKGAVGDRVEVRTGVGSGDCGVVAGLGTRVGLFLERDGELWRGNSCRQAAPADLAALPTAAGGEEIADSFADATAWVLVIVAVAAVGVFLLRRRLRPD